VFLRIISWLQGFLVFVHQVLETLRMWKMKTDAFVHAVDMFTWASDKWTAFQLWAVMRKAALES
jgi:hypothetical protein